MLSQHKSSVWNLAFFYSKGIICCVKRICQSNWQFIQLWIPLIKQSQSQRRVSEWVFVVLILVSDCTDYLFLTKNIDGYELLLHIYVGCLLILLHNCNKNVVVVGKCGILTIPHLQWMDSWLKQLFIYFNSMIRTKLIVSRCWELCHQMQLKFFFI